MYEFTRKDEMEQTLINGIGSELMIKSGSDDIMVFLHNGDMLTADKKTGKIEYDPINPGKLASSRISMRMHQWIGKGIVRITT